MLEQFYRRNSRLMLIAAILSTPWLAFEARRLPANNDIEAWLPRETQVRRAYESFRREFGGEEMILLGVDRTKVDDERIEALAGRIDRMEGVASVWTPGRLIRRMGDLGVEHEEATRRLTGLALSDRGTDSLAGVIAVLSPSGRRERARLVAEARNVIDYCQIPREAVALSGPPVIVTELDRLGNQKSSFPYFLLMLAVSLALLQYSLGHWGLSLSVLGLGVWAIQLTTAVLFWCGGEMNFIMGALSVMVMIFTVSISIHFISYYVESREAGETDPLGAALRESIRPCLLSTVTSLLGLCSLNVSSILPVSQFGYAAALGSVVALIVGLAWTPCLLVVWSNCEIRPVRLPLHFAAWTEFLHRRRRMVLATTAACLAIASLGLMRLRADVQPIQFLPAGSQVLADFHRLETGLTNLDSIEAVVDFTGRPIPLAERIDMVREFSDEIRTEPGVRHVLSAAAFFPEELPDGLALGRLLAKADSHRGRDGLISADRDLWRVSVRVDASSGRKPSDLLTSLRHRFHDRPVSFTGMTPLLEGARREIFDGFWQSFAAACATIALTMMIALRSVRFALVAMLPNLAPICLVFGVVGFLGIPVDIGMMMTGSIALGISVDCTFHFLVRYNDGLREGMNSFEATRSALEHSGRPMIDSTLVGSLGMLALCLSPFVPTSRFGCMMTAQILASMLGELVVLPAILCCFATTPVVVDDPDFDESLTAGLLPLSLAFLDDDDDAAEAAAA